MATKMSHELAAELCKDILEVLEANRGVWLTSEHVGEILSWPVVERRVREYLGWLTRMGHAEARVLEGYQGRGGRTKQWKLKEEHDADRD